MEDTINLKEVFNVLKKRFMLILLIVIVAAASSGMITYYFITPTYKATTQLLVNQSTKDELLDVNKLRTNIELTNTYSVIVKSPKIMKSVTDELNLGISATDLSKMVTVSSLQDSQVIEISVESDSATTAGTIANTIANEFKNEIKSIMQVDNVHILYDAIEDPQPVKPDMFINVMLAIVLGLCCGIGLAFLLEYLDTSIKNEKDIEDTLAIPMVGIISTIKPSPKTAQKNMMQNKVRMGGSTIES